MGRYSSYKSSIDIINLEFHFPLESLDKSKPLPVFGLLQHEQKVFDVRFNVVFMLFVMTSFICCSACMVLADTIFCTHSNPYVYACIIFCTMFTTADMAQVNRHVRLFGVMRTADRNFHRCPCCIM